MTRPLITIAGETREMDDAEFAQYEKDQLEAAAIKAAEEEAKNAKTALLERLGITADEAKLLLSQHNL